MDLPILFKSLNFDIVFTVIAEAKMSIDRASSIVSARSNVSSTSEPQQERALTIHFSLSVFQGFALFYFSFHLFCCCR
jgi:hypothetical protein